MQKQRSWCSLIRCASSSLSRGKCLLLHVGFSTSTNLNCTFIYYLAKQSFLEVYVVDGSDRDDVSRDKEIPDRFSHKRNAQLGRVVSHDVCCPRKYYYLWKIMKWCTNNNLRRRCCSWAVDGSPWSSPVTKISRSDTAFPEDDWKNSITGVWRDKDFFFSFTISHSTQTFSYRCYWYP